MVHSIGGWQVKRCVSYLYLHAFVAGWVDYCNGVLHRVSAANVQSLQNVLNAAARIILRQRKFDHITTDVRHPLHRLPVQQRLECKMCVVVYKCLHQAAPAYLTELCSPVSESANRGHLRSAARGDLVVPRSRTSRCGQRCSAVSGPILWISLPLSVRGPSLTPTQFCVLSKFENCPVLWSISKQ